MPFSFVGIITFYQHLHYTIYGQEAGFPTLYWLLGASVQKEALREGENIPPLLEHKGRRKENGESSLSSHALTITISPDGDASSLEGILPHPPRLKGFGLDVLHACFVRWTKPLTLSLLLGPLADVSRSKSQLRVGLWTSLRL